MREVEARVRRTRWQLDRRVRNAMTPLQVWDRDEGIAGLQGGVLVVPGEGIDAREALNTIQGQGFGADLAYRAGEAMSLIRIAKYDMVITARRRRGNWRLIEDVLRNFPGIRVVCFVRNADEGRQLMRQGIYSYLLPNYTADQLSTCILSGLHLRKRICQSLLRGDPCDLSCTSSFMNEGDLEELLAPIHEDPSLSRERVPHEQDLDFYQEVE